VCDLVVDGKKEMSPEMCRGLEWEMGSLADGRGSPRGMGMVEISCDELGILPGYVGDNTQNTVTVEFSRKQILTWS
jgi:hypothetical protein